MVSLPLAMIAGGGYFWVTGGRYQDTENANVQQSKVMIASDTSGRIVEVNVAENKPVKAATCCFASIPSPTASRWRRRTRRWPPRGSASSSCAPPTAGGRAGAHGGRRGRLSEDEFERQTELAGKGINTRSALDQATHDLAKARTSNWPPSRASPARAPRSAAIPISRPTGIRSVLAALATRDNAAWNLAQTTVRAPADGVVSQSDGLQGGQYVTAGTPLFSLVENGDTWVEANFKETQLTHMKVGQEAEIVLDTYPGQPSRRSSTGSAPAPGRNSRCCRRRTRPATG